jgi:hypothetical protein
MAAETSFVKAQPVSSADRRQALQALLACPTGSIGCLGNDAVKAVMKDFPLLVEEPVFYCGYNSPKSFGGNSYFVRHPAGNWLIDSPKFVTPLVRQLEAMGGIAHIFLTHRDDVADAGCNKYKSDFLAAENHLAAWNKRNNEHQTEFQAWLDEAELPCDLTATVQIAKWVYQQTEKANGQVWVMDGELKTLSPDWSKCFAP